MPMFRSFVPERIRPWIYVFIAFTFQFSGGLYLGTLNQMMGETALMREDLQMCLYANLAGMAIYFAFAVPHEVPFHEQDIAVRGGYGCPAVLTCLRHTLPFCLYCGRCASS